MATITGYTKERMDAIEANSIVGAEVVGDDLVMERHDGSTFIAGDVRGPTGSPGVTEAELNAAIDDINESIATGMPVGAVVDYIGTTAPTNWLAITGQTVTNAQTLYPLLWAIAPVAWRSGSNLVFPDSRKRVSVGYDATDSDFDAIGKVGGSKTHTLTQAQTPVKSHTHGLTDGGHSHTVNSHDHGGGTGYFNPVHFHTGTTGGMNANTTHNHTPSGSGFPTRRDFVYQTEAGAGSVSFAINGPGGAGNVYDINAVSTTSDRNLDHGHPFTTNDASINHYHSIPAQSPGTNAVTTGITVNSASDTTASAHPIVQPYITLYKIIKVA